jgi:RHS repeat-associated protein
VGRLIEGTALAGASKKQKYTYDAFGNIKAIHTYAGADDPSETPFTRFTGAKSTTNRLGGENYDQAGNQLTSAGFSYGYDSLNMLKSAAGKRYIYTPSEELVWAIDDSASPTIETLTLRGLDGKVLREYQLVGGNAVGNWTWTKDYIYRGNQLLASESPSGRLHYTLDHLGSPRLITNNSAQRVAFHQYFPFGEEATSSFQDSEKAKFTGHERETYFSGAPDLDYMHARFYSLYYGKFLSIDPGRDFDRMEPQSWNIYSYVRNNPISRIDPNGRFGFGPYVNFAMGILEEYPFNPITGTPGFIETPIGELGHLRDPRGGQGQFGASRGGGKRTHQGVDIAGYRNATAVWAAADGVVTFSGRRRDRAGAPYGNYIEIDHGGGVRTRYAHNLLNLVSKGNRIYKGQWIAIVGDTGNAKGLPAHVHFEVWIDNSRVDPSEWLNNPEW